MIHAANPILNQAPKPFDGIGVNVAFDVHAIGVLDSAVPILQWDSIVTSQKAHFVVRSEFISVNGAARSDMLLDKSSQMPVIYFGNRFRNHLASALDNRYNRSFL